MALLTSLSRSRFYKNIVFVSSSFYHNHQVSIRRAYLKSEEHIHGITEELISEEHIYVSPYEWIACGFSFFCGKYKNKKLLSPSHQANIE